MLNSMFQVDSLSDDEINEMMSDALPAGTPSEKDLLSTKQPEKKVEESDKDKDVESEKKDEAPTLATLETFEEEDTPVQGATSESKKEEQPEKKEKKADSPKDAPINYNTAVEFLIEKGVFEDFEGKDKIEFNAETFADLLEAQAKHKAETTLNEKINSMGEVAKRIIDYENNGGDPRFIIEAFREQRSLESIDLEQPESQVEIIREYYSRAGKSKNWIDKQINLLKEEGEQALKDEAVENHKLILEQIQDEISATEREQSEWEDRRKAAELQFNQGMRKFIHTDDIPERDKKDLEKFFFDYRHQLPNGQKVNELYKKWMEIQNDPKKYYKFVKFVKDFDKFEDSTKTEKEVTKKTFNFLRDTQGEANKKTTSTPEYQEKTSAKPKNPFVFKS